MKRPNSVTTARNWPIARCGSLRVFCVLLLLFLILVFCVFLTWPSSVGVGGRNGAGRTGLALGGIGACGGGLLAGDLGRCGWCGSVRMVRGGSAGPRGSTRGRRRGWPRRALSAVLATASAVAARATATAFVVAGWATAFAARATATAFAAARSPVVPPIWAARGHMGHKRSGRRTARTVSERAQRLGNNLTARGHTGHRMARTVSERAQRLGGYLAARGSGAGRCGRAESQIQRGRRGNKGRLRNGSTCYNHARKYTPHF